MKEKIIKLKIFFILFSAVLIAQTKLPPSIEECKDEPVKYIGNLQTDKYYYDGKLPHAEGVHSYQIFRANRSKPTEGGLIGWTYNHAPMMAYWNGKFYVQYLSDLKGEQEPPSRTLVLTSEDGIHWTNPVVVFPEYHLPEIDAGYGYIPKGTVAITHQRMGFYIAPNGKLLTVGFYGYSATPRKGPNLGQGLGRVVREIYEDDTLGPIYFIRYNRHSGWNESNTDYPFYKTSKDKEFIEACDSLLADKLMTQQWWEEDRAKDGFYNVDPGEYQIKAMSYFHRPDNVVVAIWKYSLAALSPNEGKTWTKISSIPTLKTCGAKVWGQRTDDGRYALIYNHSATRRNRFPLAIITGEDGYHFDNMLCVNGEVPPVRYQGIHKSIGPQYVRGIVEGNGNPPGDDIWITYSMSKEDIWVSKINLPVKGTTEKWLIESFDDKNNISDLNDWNIYMPKWAPAEIVNKSIHSKDKVLRLVDEEPYDYLVIEKIIPQSKKITVGFDIKQVQLGPAKLEFELHDENGIRPMRLRFSEDWLMFDHGPLEIDPIKFTVGDWKRIELKLDCNKQTYDVFLNGKLVKEDIPFTENVEYFHRIVFRTGPWRNDVRPFLVDGAPGNPGLYIEDMPGADDKVAPSIFEIDNVYIFNE